jgi:hypothetical protein
MLYSPKISQHAASREEKNRQTYLQTSLMISTVPFNEWDNR